MWAYEQRTGRLLHDGVLVGVGYSGSPEGKNNPSLQAVHNVGPAPRGIWTIIGPPETTATHGPFVLHLSPDSETDTFGRTGFLMHGDSVEHPGAASQGCIIMPRAVREAIWNSGDRQLSVVEG